MKTTWSRPTKYLVGAGFVFLGIFVLYLSRLVIPLLVVAALNAVIVRPVISWLHLRVHLSRGLAVGLVYLCLAILAPLVVILILPTIIDALVYVGSLDYRRIDRTRHARRAVLGVIAGLLEIIPTIGPIIAAVPAVIVALAQGSAYLPIGNLAFAGLIILFYTLVQQVENNLIVPRVLGDAVELPPLVVMTRAVVGASVGGILGVMLATPVIATGREILGYLYRKLLDHEPFPIKETVPEPGTSASTARDWLSSRLAELQRRIRMRSLESRQGSGKAPPPRSEPED